MSVFFTIFFKEIRETFRDIRSLIFMLLPVIVFPLLFSFVGMQIDNAKKEVSENYCVAVSDEALKPLLEANDKIEVVLTDNPEDAVRRGEAVIAVRYSEPVYTILYNTNSMQSMTAMSEISLFFSSLKDQALSYELQRTGADLSVLYSYVFEAKSVTGDSESASSLIIMLAPMMIIMFIFSGGMSAAVDSFSGEKERRTLESILFTQANRNSIYAAKILNVFFMSLLSMVISVCGYTISLMLNDSIVEMYGEESLSFISTRSLIFVILVVLSFAVFSSTLMCLMSISAKTAKEAQMRMSILVLIPSVLSMAVMYMENSSINIVSMFVPVLNSIMQLKLIFSGIVEIKSIILIIVVNLLYSSLFCLASSRLFKSEQIL